MKYIINTFLYWFPFIYSVVILFWLSRILIITLLSYLSCLITISFFTLFILLFDIVFVIITQYIIFYRWLSLFISFYYHNWFYLIFIAHFLTFNLNYITFITFITCYKSYFNIQPTLIILLYHCLLNIPRPFQPILLYPFHNILYLLLLNILL